jgi:hypothetical protein
MISSSFYANLGGKNLSNIIIRSNRYKVLRRTVQQYKDSGMVMKVPEAT